MGFMPDDEEELRRYFRGFFDKESGEAEVRRSMESESGHDPGLWRRAGAELGLLGLGVSEEYGGGGAGLGQMGIAFEEMGRTLACAPFLSTIALATTALSQAVGSPHAEVHAIGGHLKAIAAGEVKATLAWCGPRPATSGLRFVDGTVDGLAEIVIDGHSADLVLVAAATSDGEVGLFSVGPDAPGLTRTALVSMDATRRLARLRFEATPVETLATDVAVELDRTLDTAVLLLGAEQLGGAQRVLDVAVDYARTRVQFGRQIGSFQAVKHRCADMLMDVELARSLVYHGLDRAQNDPGTLPTEAALVRGFVSDVYVRTTNASLQIHGGIGFTWDHSLHLYLKRAKSSQLIFGGSVVHRRRLGELLHLTGDPT